MLILTTILLSLAAVIAFLVAVIHPILGIFDCVLSKRLTGIGKAIWIIASLLFGPLASLTYAFVGGGSPWLRKSGKFLVLSGTACLLMALAVIVSSPEVKQQFSSAFAIESSDEVFDLSSEQTEPVESFAGGDAWEMEPTSATMMVNTTVTDEQTSRYQIEQEEARHSGEFSFSHSASEWIPTAPRGAGKEFPSSPTTSIAGEMADKLSEGLPNVGGWLNWLSSATNSGEDQGSSQDYASIQDYASRDTTNRPTKPRQAERSKTAEPPQGEKLVATQAAPERKVFNRYTNSFERIEIPAKTPQPLVNRYLELHPPMQVLPSTSGYNRFVNE